MEKYLQSKKQKIGQITHLQFDINFILMNNDLCSDQKLRWDLSLQESSIQCQLCLKPCDQSNPLIKICQNEHSLCQNCVQLKLFRQKKDLIENVEITHYICPFCESTINLTTFIAQDKTKTEQLKHKEQQYKLVKVHRIPQNSQLSQFEKLSEQNYWYIMSFLSERDKINLVSTSLFLRSLLMESRLWGQFQISDVLSMNSDQKYEMQNWQLKIKWIEKYFPIIKPEQLKVIIRKFQQDPFLISFFLKSYPWVNKLTLYCQSIVVHLAIAKACPQITTLNVSSQVFSDELFERMTDSMKKIKNFQVFKDDPNFTAKNISKYFPEGLERIVLKPHMIEFEEIALLAKKNPDSLTQIELDIEDCSEQILIEILQSLTNVEVLKLYHMENTHIPEKIANSLSTKVRELYLTKAYHMPMHLIIEKIATPKLLTIDFTEVNLLNDKDILILAKECPYLRRFNISWCNKISEQVVATLIESCLLLQYINFTGVKCLTDRAFRQYDELLPYFDQQKYDEMKYLISKARSKKQSLDSIVVDTIDFLKKTEQDIASQKFSIMERIEEIKSLRNAKELSCVSCNGVSDKILKLIYLVNRKVNTINYYNNPMGLYSFDQLGDQTWEFN